eukprot:scaffold41902_cov73-Phaeocystis_antarctica.AAC.1
MAGVVLVAASSFPRGLGSDNSSWPLTSRQHLLIQHMPKTGGTSFRSMIFQDAARRGKTLQAHYGPAFHDIVHNSTQSTRRKSSWGMGCQLPHAL